MLKVINLWVIDRILQSVMSGGKKVKLSASEQMLYINCLIHHFRPLEATTENSMAFSVFYTDIKNYEQFEPAFKSLHKSGLIALEKKCVMFHNFWSPYIDKNLLNKTEKKTDTIQWPQPASGLREELIENNQLIEYFQSKFKLSKINTNRLIELFIKEQDAVQKMYHQLSDCKRHLLNWMSHNYDKAPKEIVKSNSKILGEE